MQFPYQIVAPGHLTNYQSRTQTSRVCIKGKNYTFKSLGHN